MIRKLNLCLSQKYIDLKENYIYILRYCVIIPNYRKCSEEFFLNQTLISFSENISSFNNL